MSKQKARQILLESSLLFNVNNKTMHVADINLIVNILLECRLVNTKVLIYLICRCFEKTDKPHKVLFLGIDRKSHI